MDCTRASEVLFEDTKLKWEVSLLESCRSTMIEARSLLPKVDENSPGLIISERQTDGRGRQGRVWESADGNLYMSLVFRLSVPVHRTVGFSLVVGLGIAEELDEVGCQAKLKWPNDILMDDGRKLAGILIEIVEEGGQTYLVTGIGVNVQSRPDIPEACSLKEQNIFISAVDLGLMISSNVWKKWNEFMEGGFSLFKDSWTRCAYNFNKPLTIDTGLTKEVGRFKGVSSQGALLLEQVDGSLIEVVSGHVLLSQGTSE